VPSGRIADPHVLRLVGLLLSPGAVLAWAAGALSSEDLQADAARQV
jgi:hypothetical protein